MVNKTLYKWFSCKKWWDSYYSWVLANEKKMRVSRYVRRLQEMDRITVGDKRKCICLVFGKRCQFCGTRYGHHLLKSLEMRTCKKCMTFRLISNGVLYFQYGLSFYDFVEYFIEKGGRILDAKCIEGGIRKSRNKDNIVKIKQYEEASDLHSYFLWRKDMELILNIDFVQLERIQRERVAAAQLLSACMIRLNLELKKSKINEKKKQFFLNERRAEKLRPYCKIKLPKCWMPGGAFYSYYDLKSTRKLSDFWWRPTFNYPRFELIKSLLEKNKLDTLKKGMVECTFRM